MQKILTKKSFLKWVENLATYQIYAPVEKNDLWSYEIVTANEITTDYPNTVLSPKKITFPQREFFLEFNQNENGTPGIKELLPQENESVIFGVRRAITPIISKRIINTGIAASNCFLNPSS